MHTWCIKHKVSYCFYTMLCVTKWRFNEAQRSAGMESVFYGFETLKINIMTLERIKEIQQETAYPNSVSVQQALLKVWNECEQERVKNCSIPAVISSVCTCTKFRETPMINGKHICSICNKPIAQTDL